MSRPNKCIKDENGVDQWISRSTVVIPIVFKMTQTGNIYALVEQRGLAVSHTNEWCCPCGFIDWDEDIDEACQREVREETGLELNLSDIEFFKVGTDKDSKSQTIDLWHQCWTMSDFDKNRIETKNEILDIKWLKVGCLVNGNPLLNTKDTLVIYEKSINAGYGKWAFRRHHLVIVEMLKHKFRNCRIQVVDE